MQRCSSCGRFARRVPVHDAALTVVHCRGCDGPTACYVLGNPVGLLFHACPVCGQFVIAYEGYMQEGVHLLHPDEPKPAGTKAMALFPAASPSVDGYVRCLGGWATMSPAT